MRRKRRRRIEQYKNLNRLCSHFFFFFARRIKKELIPTFPSFLIFTRLALFIIFLRLFYSRQTYIPGVYSSSSSSLYNAPISQIRKKETLADAWANISPFSTISSVCAGLGCALLSMFVFWNRQSKHVSHVPLCVCLIHTHTPRAALTRLGLGFSQEPNVIALLPLDCASRRPLRAAVTSFFPFPSMCVCVCVGTAHLSLSSSSLYILNNLFFHLPKKKKRKEKKIQPPFVFMCCLLATTMGHYYMIVWLFMGPCLFPEASPRTYTMQQQQQHAVWFPVLLDRFVFEKIKGIDMFFGLIVNVNSRIGRDLGKKESKSWFLTYIIEDNHNHNHLARLCAPSGRGWKGGKSNGFDTQSKEINMNKKPNHRPHRFIIRDRFFFKFPAFISWEWRCCFTSIQAKGSRWIQYVIFPL